MNIVLLPPLYLPPVSYFRFMAEADMAVIDTSMRYNRRVKQVHRTVVSGQNGPSLLTVPVSSPHSPGCSLARVGISGHGQWWRVHRSTLETLYGPTPFFHLYKKEFFDFIQPDAVGRPITGLDIDLILAVRRLCGIDTPLSACLDSRYNTDVQVGITDLRHHDFYADPGARSVIETLFTEGRI